MAAATPLVRYNALVLRAWTVLRFAWEHVMVEHGYVRSCLVAVAGRPPGRATLHRTLRRTA